MVGWCVSGVLALACLLVVWYYRSRLTDANQVKGLVAENTKVLTSLNSLLVDMAKTANAATAQDKEDAKTVVTAEDAADFLRHSLHSPTSARCGSKAGLRVTGRTCPPCFVLGFGRAVRHPAYRAGSGPGTVVEG